MQEDREFPTSVSQAQHDMWEACLDPKRRQERIDQGKSVPPQTTCAAFLMADKRKGVWQRE